MHLCPDAFNLEDARRLVAEFVTYYNTVRRWRNRLHHAGRQIGRSPRGHLGGGAEKLAVADARQRTKTQEKTFAKSQSPELH